MQTQSVISPILTIMTYHRNIDKRNTTDANRTAYPSGAPELNHFFGGIRISQSLFFFLVFYRSLLVILYFIACFDLNLLITLFMTSSLS